MSETDPDIIPEDLPEEEPAEAAEARGRDRIAAATGFVREHPGLTIAGGIAVGLIIGALLPKGRGRKLARRAVQLAEVAGASGLAFGRHARDRVESAGSSLRERGSAAADRLAGYGETATEQAERFIDTAEQVAAKAGRDIARRAMELKSRIRR